MTARAFLSLVPLALLLTTAPARAAKLHCPKAGADPNQDHQIALRYHQMGRTYLHAGDADKALSAFDCVLNLSDRIPQARLDLARAYDKLGLYSSARLHYDLALKDSSLAADHPAIRQRITELAGKPDSLKSPPGPQDVSRPDFGGEDPGGENAADGGEDPGGEDAADGGENAPPPPEPTLAELREQIAELSRREGLTPRGTPTCPTHHPAPSLTERWWYWTGLGAAALLTGAGLYGGFRAGALADDWKRDPDAGVHDDLRTMQRLTAISLTGAVLTLATVLVTAWATEPDDPPPALPR